jgi:hypothetical protein
MMRDIRDVVDRLRAEYLEMPGLRLTQEQIQTLCGLERTICTAVLDALVKEQFLSANPDGSYARVTDGIHRRPAKASIERRPSQTAKAS